MKNLNNYKKVRHINLTKQDLIDFEEKIVSLWEDGQIRAPVHLSHGNEDELIEVFQPLIKMIMYFLLGEAITTLYFTE